MEQPKFERMLRLIKMMTGNTSLTVEDMASRLDTTYRSIYRYIDTFRNAGFVVQKVGPGIYQIVSLNKKVPDLNKVVYFSEEEANILCQLLERLDNTNSLKPGLIRKLAAVYDGVPVTDFIDGKSTAMNVRDLSEAIKGHRQVILHGYRSRTSPKSTDRHIEPFAFTTNHIMVWAYDYKDRKCKTFGISRIGETEILEAEWEHQDEHEKKEADIFRMTGKRKYRIVLELGPLAHNLLLEEYPLSYKEIRREGDKWILDTSVRSMSGVVRFVAGLADDIEIIEGKELKKHLRKFGEIILSKAK